MAHRKARQRVKNEKIKNKAERIRQQERLEEERLAKREEVRRRKVMHREDFNIELKEGGRKTDEPYVKETVFRKKPAAVEAKNPLSIHILGRNRRNTESLSRRKKRQGWQKKQQQGRILL